ncbi:MAG: uridine kinase [bacterium]
MEPVIIGIAGGTGAGKTTIARRLSEPLPSGTVAVIEHDAYYRDRPELSYEERSALNFDHPDALDNDLLYEHLQALKAGRSIEKPQYNFRTHRRKAETVPIAPHPVVIVEGILIFGEKRLRDLMDIKFFVDTDPDIRVLRRLKRDINERGRDFDSVRHQYYDTVRPMHLEFVEPSKRYADLIIPEGNRGNLDIALDILLEHVKRTALP